MKGSRSQKKKREDMHKFGKVRPCDGKCPWEGRRLAELILLVLDTWNNDHQTGTSDDLEYMSAAVYMVSVLTANPNLKHGSMGGGKEGNV